MIRMAYTKKMGISRAYLHYPNTNRILEYINNALY